MWRLVAGVFLGWGLGGNDFANVFGPAVGSGLVRYRTATLLGTAFLVLGAVVEGPKCMTTVGTFTTLTPEAAFLVVAVAGAVIVILTILALPASVSQAVIGGLVGLGAAAGQVDLLKLWWIVGCWFAAPLAALAAAMVLYRSGGPLFDRLFTNLYRRHQVLLTGVVAAGCYGAYSLGANNVANVTGAYVGAGVLAPTAAALLGAAAMALGVLTFSGRVLDTVGKRIVPLDPFSALVVTLANGLTLHLFTQFQVPVSATQTIVGAVVGVGLCRDFRLVSGRTLALIATGWFATPLAAAVCCYLLAVTAVG